MELGVSGSDREGKREEEEEDRREKGEGRVRYQSTLARPFTLSGVGLHTGVEAKVTLRPAPAGTGRIFKREESRSLEPTRAHISNVQFPAVLCTTLGPSSEEAGDGADSSSSSRRRRKRKVTVRLTEHLLSALEGFGCDNCVIEVSGGEEIPILDGSALPWVKGVRDAGVVDALDERGQQVKREFRTPERHFTVADGESFVSFYPGGTQVKVSYGIDFTAKAQVIGKQWISWSPEEEGAGSYEECIAPARTFCCLEDIAHMRSLGLIKGGDERCALIAEGDRWVNQEQVRFHSDEQARHKILDLVGDLALVAERGNAALPVGHIVAYKAGHNLHLKFAQQLLEQCRQ